MKLAAYQAPVLPTGSMDALELIERRVRWCEAEAIDVLVCPEAVVGGLADDAPRSSDLALDVGSGQLRRVLTPLASATVTTVLGFTEAADGGVLYNSAAVFSAGEVLGVYRKRHPAIRQSVYSPGTESPVFAIGDWRFGILICNDTNYPELSAEMVVRGAQILLVPSNNLLPRVRADVLALTRKTDQSIARTNRVPLVRADVAGQSGDRMCIGSSAIIDAKGTVLRAGLRLREDILLADFEHK